MDSLEKNIRRMVEQIVSGLNLEETDGEATAAPAVSPSTNSAPADAGGDAVPAAPGIFRETDAAVAAARTAHRALTAGTLETRRDIIQAIRDITLEKNEEVARRVVAETGLGRWEDKTVKHRLVATRTPGVEDLRPGAFTDDNGMSLIERAPYGVIGAIIPCTNPTSTVVNNAIAMIAGGNAVVFGPHPAAKRVSCLMVSLLNEAIVAAGGPPNLVTALGEPSIEKAGELMKHEDVDILVVTGGPAVVKAAMNSGKKVIAAGPGNPPVVVDETADIEKAGQDIVRSGGFDNNIVCVCEKEVLVVESVADRLMAAMCANGAVALDDSQADAVTKLVIADPGRPGHEGAPDKKFVGKNAAVIAQAAGIDVPASTRLLLCAVGRDHPLVWTEQLMPVMPVVRMPNVDEAIDLAVRCEHGFRHTAVMHSKNIEKLSRMAKVIDSSIFVKNGPSFSGLGEGGAGFTSFTIASPTGDGLTRPTTFTRERRCALIDYFRIV